MNANEKAFDTVVKTIVPQQAPTPPPPQVQVQEQVQAPPPQQQVQEQQSQQIQSIINFLNKSDAYALGIFAIIGIIVLYFLKYLFKKKKKIVIIIKTNGHFQHKTSVL